MRFLSSWIICWGKGSSAQLTLCRLPLSAASVITFFSFASISSRAMPLIIDSGTKHLCTYWRTAGGQSIFFFTGEGAAGASVGCDWYGAGW